LTSPIRDAQALVERFRRPFLEHNLFRQPRDVRYEDPSLERVPKPLASGFVFSRAAFVE
jgi:hypothetical protein